MDMDTTIINYPINPDYINKAITDICRLNLDDEVLFTFQGVESELGYFHLLKAINRELEIEGHATRVTYFCPSPADTEAEKPFHVLWKKIGITIVPVEKVA